MAFPKRFIYAGPEKNTFESFVAAPYLRRSVEFKEPPRTCRLTVACPGFYRVWINGEEITRCLLAPYISNPDQLVYSDEYDIASQLRAGRNVIAFMLGNGMQNNPGGRVWDFDLEPFCASPRIAFLIEGEDAGGSHFAIEADGEVKTARSPLYFDDLRCGDRYDARLEKPGWEEIVYDDSDWQNAVVCESPRGEMRLCTASPVLPTGEQLLPVSVKPGRLAPYKVPHKLVRDIVPSERPGESSGYLYDFGVNSAGTIRLKIKDTRPGQRVELQFGEFLDPEGRLSYNNIDFYPDGYSQRDVYICRGAKEEVFEPPFTYHGLRYCLVMGIDEEQAKPELLTFIIVNAALKSRGSFACSDDTLNTIRDMCRRTDLANFYWFPTDCPHREKNGWTGDASFSAEHIMMYFDASDSYEQWLDNIRASQRPDGELPSMIPTGRWGYGLNPIWDKVVVNIPYYVYMYTGNKRILQDNAHTMLTILDFISHSRTPHGTIDKGLGDWCPIGFIEKADNETVVTISVMDMAKKAAFIFKALGQEDRYVFARTLYDETRTAIRSYLMDMAKKQPLCLCQTTMAMAIWYGVFDEGESTEAFRKLVEMIHAGGDVMDTGMVGTRVIFRLLAKYGEAELAYRMITARKWPSYAHLIDMGLTTIPEAFFHGGGDEDSLDHHAFDDISGFFVSCLSGLNFNPNADDLNYFEIKPAFISELNFAEAAYDSPAGRIFTRWERDGEAVKVSVDYPRAMRGRIILPAGWYFEQDSKTIDWCREADKGQKRLTAARNDYDI